jgi:hypothetical protein
MSQLIYGFVEVRRQGRWRLVPEAKGLSAEGGKTLQHLLIDLFHHGAVMDESILQLDTSADALSDNWVDAAHVSEVLSNHPQLQSQELPPGAFQLDYATLSRFEWPRRLKWLLHFLPESLEKGRFEPQTQTWKPSRLEDFLVTDAAGVERIAAGDARVADDAARELTAREFQILSDFPTSSFVLQEYESESRRRRAEPAHFFLIYRSYQELLRGSRFLEELLPAMGRLVATADEQRPENVRLVFWFE